MIVTLWIISIISFVVIQLPPGDYLTTLAINLEASGYPVEEAMLERYRIRFGLDKTLFEQYFIWITNFVQGDMGYSFEWRANVNTLIWERLLPHHSAEHVVADSDLVDLTSDRCLLRPEATLGR